MPDADSTPKKRARRGEAIQFVRDAAASSTDECIRWPENWGSENGYGRVKYKGRMVLAHRLSLSLATGVTMRDAREAAHGPCHNPLCLNPGHLSWKTMRENQRDRLRDGTTNRGERSGHSKLTSTQVLEIRASTDTHRAVAERFNISKTQVSRIKNRKVWAWLD